MANATLKEQAVTDLAIVFDTGYLADTVTFDGTEIPAIVEYGDSPDAIQGGSAAKAVVTVRVSDVASPGYRSTIIIKSDTWRVLKVLSGDGMVWELECTRDKRKAF